MKLRRQSGQYDGGSSESDVESDMAREIREESCRIQKEIELERKANKIRETTPKKTEHKQSNKKTPTSNGRPTSHNLPAAYNINMTQSMPSLPHIQVTNGSYMWLARPKLNNLNLFDTEWKKFHICRWEVG